MDDGEVFAAHYDALRRFAAVVRPAGVDPDDLVQEALARTLRRTRLRDLDNPRAYLRRSILNLATTHRSKHARRAQLDGRLDRRLHVVDDYPSDLDELRRLPPEQRAVLYLHVVERASHEEIAAVLEISEEASRARLSRGLRQLRVEIDRKEVRS